nr:hypothetical protein [Pleurocapsa sp. PCC 7327]
MQNALEKKPSLPLPPGSFGLPLIGETISFLRDRNFADKRQKSMGQFSRPIFLVVPLFISVVRKRIALSFLKRINILLLLGPKVRKFF